MRLLVDTVSQTNGLGFVFADGRVIQKSFDRLTESRFMLESISEVLAQQNLETSNIVVKKKFVSHIRDMKYFK